MVDKSVEVKQCCVPKVRDLMNNRTWDLLPHFCHSQSLLNMQGLWHGRMSRTSAGMLITPNKQTNRQKKPTKNPPSNVSIQAKEILKPLVQHFLPPYLSTVTNLLNTNFGVMRSYNKQQKKRNKNISSSGSCQMPFVDSGSMLVII